MTNYHCATCANSLGEICATVASHDGAYHCATCANSLGEWCGGAHRTETVIVTRHPALVDLLVERGLIAESDRARVIEHARPEDVIGRRVIGVLPLHLAALAERVVEIPLRLRPEHRGQELDLATLREIAAAPVEYSVCRVADIPAGDLDAMEAARNAARISKACPRCRGLGGALGDGISSSIDEPCHSGPRVSSDGAILR